MMENRNWKIEIRKTGIIPHLVKGSILRVTISGEKV
jgi:hypothetical protein